VLRGNAVEPHEVELTREVLGAAPPAARVLKPGIGYLRVGEFGEGTAAAVRKAVAQLERDGATSLVVDVRSAAARPPRAGLAAARLFVPGGTLALLDTRNEARRVLAAAAATAPSRCARPAHRLRHGRGGRVVRRRDHRQRARAVVRRADAGPRGVQRLFLLPDGGGLWMSHAWYLTPAGAAIHERGLQPDVPVPSPMSNSARPRPPGTRRWDKAVERLAGRTAP